MNLLEAPMEIMISIFLFIPRKKYPTMMLVCKTFQGCIGRTMNLQKGERGIFIVFEGTDKVGKTTHSKRITEWINEVLKKETGFENVSAKYLHFPDTSTDIGKKIVECSKQENFSPQALHILHVANRVEKQYVLLSLSFYTV